MPQTTRAFQTTTRGVSPARATRSTDSPASAGNVPPRGSTKRVPVGTFRRVEVADRSVELVFGEGADRVCKDIPEAACHEQPRNLTTHLVSLSATKTGDGWVHTGDAGYFTDRGHLKIIDRAKDVGRLNNGALFAPKYIENKLKFFPEIKEAVAFGHQRDYCAVFVNIDLAAVGSWAERNNVAYASYQELAANPKVLATIKRHIEAVNRDLSEDPKLAGSQIKRFIVLHKELDADDGELTRTRKVRRGTIEEKYADLVTALYDGSKSVYTETEVTYEDGRKGSIKATLEIRDVTVPGVEHKVAAE